jgi:hypothetical protein
MGVEGQGGKEHLPILTSGALEVVTLNPLDICANGISNQNPTKDLLKTSPKTLLF